MAGALSRAAGEAHRPEDGGANENAARCALLDRHGGVLAVSCRCRSGNRAAATGGPRGGGHVLGAARSHRGSTEPGHRAWPASGRGRRTLAAPDPRGETLSYYHRIGHHHHSEY